MKKLIERYFGWMRHLTIFPPTPALDKIRHEILDADDDATYIRESMDRDIQALKGDWDLVTVDFDNAYIKMKDGLTPAERKALEAERRRVQEEIMKIMMSDFSPIPIIKEDKLVYLDKEEEEE